MDVNTIVFWHWWILAVLLLGVEMLAPGFFFLWLALSGFVTGSLLLLAPALDFEWQLSIFSTLSVLSVVVWRRYGKFNVTETDHPLLNQRGAQYIGRTFNLTAAIENGYGKIKVDDTLWKVTGEDCPLQTKVKVVAVNGTVLTVQKAGGK